VARITNYARKFFGKRMQKVKVRKSAGKKSNRNRKEDGEDGRRREDEGAAADDDSDKCTVLVRNRVHYEDLKTVVTISVNAMFSHFDKYSHYPIFRGILYAIIHFTFNTTFNFDITLIKIDN